MAALARFLLASSDAANRNLFIQREMANRGPAFDFLYERLWGPGIEFTAVLVESAAGGRLSQAEAGVGAALMITSLAGFGEGRAVIERAVSAGDGHEYANAARKSGEATWRGRGLRSGVSSGGAASKK